MNQNEMMREALRQCHKALVNIRPFVDERMIEQVVNAEIKASQALNHAPDTGKMVRLSDDSLISIYLACKAEWKTANKRQRERIAIMFGNALQDAMIKKNGG